MKRILMLVLLFITSQLANSAAAAPSDLDSTWGNGGIVVTSFGTNYSYVGDLHTQPDGKIIVSGELTGGFFIVRYNRNGTLDTSFGTNGRVIIQHGISDWYYNSALQPDGKIVVGGREGGNFALARYHADGTLDTAFGTNGRVITPVSFSAATYDLIVQLDGKIIAVGGNPNFFASNDFAIVRYNSNGTLDADFGEGGKLIVYLTDRNDYASSVALQPDGKIVVGGTANGFGAFDDFGLARLLPNGALDSTFGAGGKVIFRAGGGVLDLALQPDGKIIAAGVTYENENGVFVRYNANGSLDASFAENGLLIFGGIIGGYFFGYSVAVQPNGKILSTGFVHNNLGVGLGVIRYNTNGSLDATFGTNGIVVTPNAGDGKEIALQPDGKIIVAGSGQGGIAIARYLGDSTAQRARQFDFDGDGKSDIAVFRPSNGTWYLQLSQAGFTGVAFGQAGDKITPADYDGDGKTDIAVYRNGTWYLQRSSAGFTGIAFGAATDIPVPADFDGDGRAELAVYRPSNGTWYFYNLANNQTSGIAFGASEDKPVPADYDGDGRADVAVFRPSNGTWYLQRSQLGFAALQFGEGTDKPVPADYDGDGKADVAVLRPTNGTWYLQRSQSGLASVAFGLGTDTPTPADYDGDGKADIAVFRNGVWYLQQSASGFTGVTFGAASDVPVEAAYLLSN